MFKETAVLRINEQLDELEYSTRIVIWGVAETLHWLFQHTEINRFRIQGLVDRKEAGIRLYGYDVVSPDEICWKEIDVCIIASFYATKSITDDLHKTGFDGRVICINKESEIPVFNLLSEKELSVPEEYKSILNNNGRFKDIGRGKRLFLAGNAPGINKMDLKKLANEDVMVLNLFFAHKDYEVINPQYYVLPQNSGNQDVSFFREFALGTRDYSQPQYIFDISNKKCVDQVEDFLGRDVSYYYLDYLPLAKYNDVDMTKKMLMNGSCLQDALEIAIYMNYSQIYIIGVELDMLSNKQYHHFYSVEDARGLHEKNDEINNWMDLEPYHHKLERLALSWRHFFQLKKIAEKRQIQIFNASVGGVLDVFERVEFESIF